MLRATQAWELSPSTPVSAIDDKSRRPSIARASFFWRQSLAGGLLCVHSNTASSSPGGVQMICQSA